MEISLRAARESDIDWLEPFYENLMRPYVELTHPWDAMRFRESFDPSLASIIVADGRDIGLLKKELRSGDLYLGDIQIHSDYQGAGIGTNLVRQVIAEGESLGLPVRLRVHKGNPAHQWYLRLGFTVETELNNCYQLIKLAEQVGAPNPLQSSSDVSR